MKKLKPNDTCIVAEIGECDLWYNYRDLVIGKRVAFEGFITAPVHAPGFIACLVLFIDPIPSLSVWTKRPAAFYCVKLEKT
jgi:hypothetical protein